MFFIFYLLLYMYGSLISQLCSLGYGFEVRLLKFKLLVLPFR